MLGVCFFVCIYAYVWLRTRDSLLARAARQKEGLSFGDVASVILPIQLWVVIAIIGTIIVLFIFYTILALLSPGEINKVQPDYLFYELLEQILNINFLILTPVFMIVFLLMYTFIILENKRFKLSDIQVSMYVIGFLQIGIIVGRRLIE